MENKLKQYTTSYKYFYNDNIVFVTSAKVGSRFIKAVSENLEYDKYQFPMNMKLNEIEFNHLLFPERSNFTEHVFHNLYKDKEVIFMIRNPYKRFISGMTTNLSIFLSRIVERGEDGKDFMKHYFKTEISDKELENGISEFKILFYSFLETKDPNYLKSIITNFVLPYSIYKDAHVEHHHYMGYNYMNDLKERGVNIKVLDITKLDSFIKSKEISDWGYSSKMDIFKASEKDNLFYKCITDNLETWKSEINELSLYLEFESGYYHKIQTEYQTVKIPLL